MMNADIDEIVQWYDRFLENIKQIAEDAEKQIQRLKGTAIADEIANDFSEIGMFYAKKLMECEWITKD